MGNKTATTDANAKTTTWTYDANNHLSTVTAPTGAMTAYAYDPTGNLTSRTDANGHVTRYGYDPANRLVSLTSPLGQVWRYAYDANGNRTTTVTPEGNATPADGDGTIANRYDELNRLVGIDYSDPTPDVSFSYDANGNRTTMTDGAGTETSSYDALDRLAEVTRADQRFAYAYDPAGNVTQRTYPDGTVFDYAYDGNGRLSGMTTAGTTTTCSYDPAGHPVGMSLPNGFGEQRSFDAAGRITSVRHASSTAEMARLSYTYDKVGNPIKVVDRRGSTNLYRYDGLNRVAKACFATTACAGATDYVNYVYDSVGNRTKEITPSGTTTYAYNEADQLVSLTTPGGVTKAYRYDASGHQTEAGSRRFTYDLADRMVTTTSGSTTTSYSYDGDGKRLQSATGGNATKFLWDTTFEVPQLAIEQDAAGQLRRRYSHGNDLVSMASPTDLSYYHHDALGSVVNLTAADGRKLYSYDYGPFGTSRRQTKHVTTAPLNRMRFAGEYLDATTGLYHLRARQYSAGLGRFLGTDPVTPDVTDPYVASYVYANNRPTVLTDPTGEFPVLNWLAKEAAKYVLDKGVVTPIKDKLWPLQPGERVEPFCQGTIGFLVDLIPVPFAGCRALYGASDQQEADARAKYGSPIQSGPRHANGVPTGITGSASSKK